VSVSVLFSNCEYDITLLISNLRGDVTIMGQDLWKLERVSRIERDCRFVRIE
jgi:hypothetical protein